MGIGPTIKLLVLIMWFPHVIADITEELVIAHGSRDTVVSAKAIFVEHFNAAERDILRDFSHTS